MTQRSVDSWDKVLAEEEAAEKEEEKVLEDIDKLRKEQGRDGLSTDDRVEQFEKLAELYSKKGQRIGARLLRKEAEDLKRLQRQADAARQAKEAKARAEIEAEDARIQKLREISTALKFSEEEFQNMLKDREIEMKKAGTSGKVEDNVDSWGVGWKKKNESRSQDTNKTTWISKILKMISLLILSLVKRAPSQATQATG
mmetsp:Transcript_32210/g.44692  ORF Transcript_32210/g.44692 Transcript_32210/m.44692 type:complete len:199 (-) Transcript_32210:197-793(-)|eukprot:CAMPEP_0196587756 /NCGR_PEP_ID=MMETSP1081-20130531/58506_1 /TAXON_ID=36882 /ORGANISM="Pyramimonas amylifera, Strain CCMP720" /LENGTH=198 /DNA_ID=CAMNT_0041910031 /DNA_START=340 /DNA_END=936 /DNA_ORIENTATION=-